MFEKHTTREGQTGMICVMSDSHLAATIRLHLHNLSGIVDASAQAANEMTPYQKALYGVKDIDPGAAAQATRRTMEKLYPYLAEVLMRPDIVSMIANELQQCLNRAGPVVLPGPAFIRALPAQIEEIDLNELPF